MILVALSAGAITLLVVPPRCSCHDGIAEHLGDALLEIPIDWSVDQFEIQTLRAPVLHRGSIARSRRYALDSTVVRPSTGQEAQALARHEMTRQPRDSSVDEAGSTRPPRSR